MRFMCVYGTWNESPDACSHFHSSHVLPLFVFAPCAKKNQYSAMKKKSSNIWLITRILFVFIEPKKKKNIQIKNSMFSYYFVSLFVSHALHVHIGIFSAALSWFVISNVLYLVDYSVWFDGFRVVFFLSLFLSHFDFLISINDEMKCEFADVRIAQIDTLSEMIVSFVIVNCTL